MSELIDDLIARLREEYGACDSKHLILKMQERMEILAGPLVKCEADGPDCGPAEHTDSEGVPLCRTCWKGLLADSQDLPEDRR